MGCEGCRLDGKHVVFGTVMEGLELLAEIERHGSQSGTTDQKIVVAGCGQLLPEAV